MAKAKTSLMIISAILLCMITAVVTYFSLVSFGYIETSAVELVIQVGSEEKVYDGNELVPDSYELISGKLDDGHYIEVDFMGSQTDVGVSSSNAKVSVYDKNNFDVSDEYAISVKKGELLVTHRTIKIELDKNSKPYDGTPLYEAPFEISEGILAEGHKLVPSFNSNSNVTNVGDVGKASLSTEIYDYVGNNVTDNYIIEINDDNASLSISGKPLIVTTQSANKVFDGEPLVNTDYLVDGLLEGHSLELIDVNAVTSVTNVTTTSVLNVLHDESDGNSYNFFIADENGYDVTDQYTIAVQNVGLLTVNPYIIEVDTPDITYVYNGLEQTFLFDPTTLFSTEDKDLINSIGYNIISNLDFISATDAGQYRNDLEILVLNEYNMTQSNIIVDIVYYGTLSITEKDLIAYGENLEKTFDGDVLSSALYNDRTTTYNLNDVSGLEDIHIINAQYTTDSLITDVGQCRNVIQSVYITDSAGKDVTDNYNCVFVDGLLTVTKANLEVITNDYELTYGEEFDVGIDSSYSYVDPQNIIENLDYEIIPSNDDYDYTNAGEYDNKIDIEIYDKYGAIVSDNFNINFKYGKIKVNQKEIFVNLKDYEEEYDGTGCLHIDSAYVLLDEDSELVQNDTLQVLEYDYPMYDLSVGQEGKYTYQPGMIRIYNNNGDNVTNNYKITANNSAKCKITKKFITISSYDFGDIYYSENLDDMLNEIVKETRYTATNLPSGYDVELSYKFKDNQILNVGTYEIDFTISKILDEKGNVLELEEYEKIFDISKVTDDVNIVPMIIYIEAKDINHNYGTVLAYKVNQQDKWFTAYNYKNEEIDDSLLDDLIIEEEYYDLGEYKMELPTFDPKSNRNLLNYDIRAKNTGNITIEYSGEVSISNEVLVPFNYKDVYLHEVDLQPSGLIQGHKLYAYSEEVLKMDIGKKEESAVVAPIDYIVITDSSGKDVTMYYTEVDLVGAEVSLDFQRFAYTIVLEDVSKEYDGEVYNVTDSLGNIYCPYKTTASFDRILFGYDFYIKTFGSTVGKDISTKGAPTEVGVYELYIDYIFAEYNGIDISYLFDLDNITIISATYTIYE